MKPENTKSQQARRKDAILGAISSTVLRLTIAVAALWLRASAAPSGLTAKLLLLVFVIDLGSIPLIWVSFRTRWKEIEGGEEDAAAQY